jgi:NAD(P)-dependent dehydrogenase (short-subunit alcohol dehydrogenase family)
MEVRDKVVVVTGAANGIGRALAKRFSEEGAGKIIIADLDEQGLKRVETETGAESFKTNVASEADIKQLINSCERKYGGIDLLCNNAGIGVNGGPEVPNEDWQKIWEINVMAHVYAARAAIPGMLRRGSGYILNTASAAGLLSQIGSAPYAVTKHAAVSFAEWLAITYGDRGLKVSVLCPQAVRTAMTAEDPDGVASVDGMIEPEQVSEAVVTTLKNESFLVLPHPKVLDYIQRKSGDYDRWIEGMKKLQSSYGVSDWP